MKNFIFCLLILSTTHILTAQIVDIPDPNFKQGLLDHVPEIDTNNDGEIQVTEALATAQLILTHKEISDMTGIEEFVNLLDLFIYSNPISSIDVTHNINLRQFGLGYTEIAELDVSQNTNLYTLKFYNTLISEIDLSHNPNLEFLNVGGSSLTELDISNNLNLIILNIFDTNISSLNFSANTNLQSLNFLRTGILEADYSVLPNLKKLAVGSNNILSLDVSQNSQLCSLFIQDGPILEFVNVKNGNNELLLPNGPCSFDLTYGGAASSSGILANTGNPSLQYICVDDVQFAEENFIWIPPQTEFIDNCNLSTQSNQLSVLKYYPNPVKDYLHISFDSPIISVQVYSVLGEELSSILVGSEEASVALKDLVTGNYFVSVTSNNGKEVFQVVKE